MYFVRLPITEFVPLAYFYKGYGPIHLAYHIGKVDFICFLPITGFQFLYKFANYQGICFQGVHYHKWLPLEVR